MTQGSANTQVGYTKHVRTIQSSGGFAGYDTEDTGDIPEAYIEAHYNAFSNFRADTSFAGAPIARSGVSVDSYGGSGSAGSHIGSYARFTLGGVDIANTKVVKLHIAGKHAYSYWASGPGFQGYRVDTGVIDVQLDDSGIGLFSSGADLYDNLPANKDLSISFAQLNEGYNQAGQNLVLNPVEACYVDIDVDPSIITGMSGSNLFVWFRIPFTIFPYRSVFNVPNNSGEEEMAIFPLLHLYY